MIRGYITTEIGENETRVHKLGESSNLGFIDLLDDEEERFLLYAHITSYACSRIKGKFQEEVIGIICEKDETHYRHEVYSNNNKFLHYRENISLPRLSYILRYFIEHQIINYNTTQSCCFSNIKLK